MLYFLMPAIQWLATSSFVDHFFIPVNDELTCTRKILEHSNDSHVEVLLATAIEISRYLQINQLKNMIRGLPILPVQGCCAYLSSL
jgi:hypothetical protein